MKLSRLTDYAVIVLTKLSFADDEPASAARLSEDLMLPQPTVSKLLKMLTKAELLIAQRGPLAGTASAAVQQPSVSETSSRPSKDRWR